MLTQLNHFARCVVCAVGLLFCTVFATPTWASVIYEFHELGSSALIGTLEIESPPASETTGWSTNDPSDLIALHLLDSLFHLGTGNLLSTAAPTDVAILSLDGLNLDAGILTIVFPTIDPINPLDPTIDRSLAFLFGPAGGGDFMRLATISRLADGSVVTEDSFHFGDASVPEPGTAGLMMIGLAAAARKIAQRKRR